MKLKSNHSNQNKIVGLKWLALPYFEIGMQLGAPPGKMAAVVKKVFAQVPFVESCTLFLTEKSFR